MRALAWRLMPVALAPAEKRVQSNTKAVQMQWCVSVLLLFSAVMVAQTPGQTGLLRQAEELQSAIRNDSLSRATEIATELDASLQAQHRAWLIRDASDRVEEALSWLPTDVEGFWVNQEPYVLNAGDSAQLLSGRPTQLYSLDRLIAMNEGQIYRSLSNRTIRLAIAAVRGMPRLDIVSVPSATSTQDIVCFYFFTAPIDLSSPDESIQGRPVWQASARIDAGGPFRPGAPREQRDDPNWLALARPDMLILANRKDLLTEVLGRVVNGSRAKALPATLPVSHRA